MKTENKTKKRQKAKKLMQKYEISYALAFAVANNECSLHEALIQARKELDFTIAVEKHSLNAHEQKEIRSGAQSLTDILVRKHYKKQIDSCDAQPRLCVGFSGFFWRHGGEVLHAEVLSISQYDVELSGKDGICTIPKLQIKAFSAVDVQPHIENQKDVSPIVRIEERFRISNRLLYRFVLEKPVLRVAILGGLCFEGTLTRAGRYECAIQTEDDVEIVVMRHALLSMEVREDGIA